MLLKIDQKPAIQFCNYYMFCLTDWFLFTGEKSMFEVRLNLEDEKL